MTDRPNTVFFVPLPFFFLPGFPHSISWLPFSFYLFFQAAFSLQLMFRNDSFYVVHSCVQWERKNQANLSSPSFSFPFLLPLLLSASLLSSLNSPISSLLPFPYNCCLAMIPSLLSILVSSEKTPFRETPMKISDASRSPYLLDAAMLARFKPSRPFCMTVMDNKWMEDGRKKETHKPDRQQKKRN